MLQVLEQTYLCECCNTNRVECWTEPCRECQARNLETARSTEMKPTGGSYKIFETVQGGCGTYAVKNGRTFSEWVATICPHGKDDKQLAADAVLVGFAREMFEHIQHLAVHDNNVAAAWLMAEMDAKYRELLEVSGDGA